MWLIKRQNEKGNEGLTPFGQFGSILDEFDRLFETPLSGRNRTERTGKWIPTMEVVDEENEIRVETELPGLKKEDISIDLHDGVLSISGKRKQENENKKGSSVRTERYYGEFQRSVSLSTEIDVEKVDAEFKDGLLKVHLPKAVSVKPKQIDIKLK
ncbi:MAG TPA: Hsp20/alpha crystallin family protein [Verrucomicrobiales bacterium]|nr:Hsp20/alpha crystallin family protein [Verrucomicrobiales bacterium]